LDILFLFQAFSTQFEVLNNLLLILELLYMLFPAAELFIFLFIDRLSYLTVATALLLHHFKVKESIQQLLLIDDKCGLTFKARNLIPDLRRGALLPSQLRRGRKHCGFLFLEFEHEISIQHHFSLVLEKVTVHDGGCDCISGLFVQLESIL
jgi:hypothetical protein